MPDARKMSLTPPSSTELDRPEPPVWPSKFQAPGDTPHQVVQDTREEMSLGSRCSVFIRLIPFSRRRDRERTNTQSLPRQAGHRALLQILGDRGQIRGYQRSLLGRAKMIGRAQEED